VGSSNGKGEVFSECSSSRDFEARSPFIVEACRCMLSLSSVCLLLILQNIPRGSPFIILE